MQTHVRYFIKRINKLGEISYRDSTGSWTLNFDRAMLWSDSAFVDKKIEQLNKQVKQYRPTDTLYKEYVSVFMEL